MRGPEPDRPAHPASLTPFPRHRTGNRPAKE